MLASLGAALGGIAFYLGALYLHGKTQNVKVQWVAAGTSFAGGIAVAASSLDNQIFGTVAKIDPVLPALIGAVALAVAGVDLSDAKPDRPATHALFYFSLGLPPFLAALASDNLRRAIVLAVVAAIAATREADAYDRIVRIIAVCIGVAAGISFSQTGVASGVVDWLGTVVVGLVGFFAFLGFFADLADKKPGWLMTSTAYILPTCLPALGLLVTQVTGISA